MMNNHSKQAYDQVASMSSEDKFNVNQNLVEQKDKRKERYLRIKSEQPDIASNQTCSKSSQFQNGSAETSGERVDLDQSRSTVKYSSMTTVTADSVRGYGVSLKESSSEPLDSKRMHMIPDKVVNKQNLRRSTRFDAIKLEQVSPGQSPESGSDGKQPFVNKGRQFKNGAPQFKAGTKRRQQDRIDSDGFVPPTSHKRKNLQQPAVQPSTSGKDGSSSCGLSPGLRKQVLGNGLHLGNKEALPARTFDEAREDEIIALIEQHQRDQLKKDPMRELEEALMDRTTASLNRKQKLTQVMPRQLEEVITPTFIQIDLESEPPLKVISQTTAERFQEIAQQKMDQMIQRAQDDTWSSVNSDGPAARKEKAKRFKVDLQSPKKYRKLNQGNKASEQGYFEQSNSQAHESNTRKSERVRRRDPFEAGSYHLMNQHQHFAYTRMQEAARGQDIKSHSRSKSRCNNLASTADLNGIVEQADYQNFHSYHSNPRALHGNAHPQDLYQASYHHDQTVGEDLKGSSLRAQGRMLVEKYSGMKNSSPSLRDKLQMAGHFNESQNNYSPSQHSSKQQLPNQVDYQRKRDAKNQQKEQAQLDRYSCQNESGLNNYQQATPNKLDVLNQSQNCGEGPSNQNLSNSGIQKSHHKLQRSQSRPVNGLTQGLDETYKHARPALDDSEPNQRLRSQIRIQAKQPTNFKEGAQKTSDQYSSSSNADKRSISEVISELCQSKPSKRNVQTTKRLQNQEAQNKILEQQNAQKFANNCYSTASGNGLYEYQAQQRVNQEYYGCRKLRSNARQAVGKSDIKMGGLAKYDNWAGDTPQKQQQLLNQSNSTFQQQRSFGYQNQGFSPQEVALFADQQGHYNMQQIGNVYLRILPPPEDSDSSSSTVSSKRRSNYSFGKTLRKMIALTNMLTVYQMHSYQSDYQDDQSMPFSEHEDEKQQEMGGVQNKETLNQTLRRLLGPQDDEPVEVKSLEQKPSRDDQGFVRPENVIRDVKNQPATYRLAKKQ